MDISIKKILITGSSGTIGTRLFETLLEQGYDVIGVDKESHSWNNQSLADRTIILDLRDKTSVINNLPKDVDLIIHLAANARVHNLVIDPSLARDNFEITFNVLEFARENNIKKFMFSSSREVYGNSEKITHTEDDVHLLHCESPYTASKIGGEALVRSYHLCYQIDSVIFRLSNVYGMYDKSDRLIPLFIRLCHEGSDLVVYGKDKIVDLTYIDDCIAGIASAIADFSSVKNKVYNLAYGSGSLITDVAYSIQKKMHSQNKVQIQGNRTGEVIQYIADITMAKNSFAFNPKTSVQEGIELSVDWYLKNVYIS